MGDFSVVLQTRSGDIVTLPAGMTLTPVRWSGSLLGGWDTAEIEVSGPEQAIMRVRGWLRYKAQIHGAGGLLWEGYINEIGLRLGAVTATVSTERMFNAINVIYSFTGDDGGGDTATTGWLVDNNSASVFGRKDALHSAGGEITATQAEALRLTVLNAAARATAPEISVGGGGMGGSAGGEPGTEYAATLHCGGPFADLDWRYYEDATGTEMHEETGGARVLLGWAYTASTIGFVGSPINRILDYAGKLTPLDEGDQLKISGSGSNNGVKVIAGPASGDIQSYTANTISFEPADDIMDSAQGLGFIRAQEGIKVTNSPNNDGYYYIGDVTGPGRVEAASAFGAVPIVSDSAGSSFVTIDMAHNVESETALANEIPNNSVTLTAYGQKVGMRFQVIDGPWQAGEVAIHVAKHGAPTDNVLVELRADSAGKPGTLLTSGTLNIDQIPPESRGWRSVQLTTPTTLVNGTNYHLVIARTGSAHAENYFSLSLDDEAGYARGQLWLWDGSAWQARATNAHMPFKVWGVMDTTAKIAEIVTATAGGLTGVFAATAAGVRTRKTRDGRSTAGDEVRQLLDMGSSLGQRMTAIARTGGTLVLDFASDVADSALVWSRDGSMRYASGGPLPPGVLPLGRWLVIEQLQAGDWQADITRFLIDSVEYDAQNGTWTPRPPEAADPFDIGTQQG